MKAQEILNLEKQFNTTFEKVNIDEIRRHQGKKTAQYCQDQEGNITGFCMMNFDLKEIPKTILKFKKLAQLNFSSNSISDISPIAALGNLTRINFYSNSIGDIPLVVFQNLKEIDNLSDILHNNPLQNPSKEIISQGKQAFFQYFKDLEEEEG